MNTWIVGTGMDGVKTLTCEALEIILSADILIGAERMLEPFEHLEKPMLKEYSTERIAECIRENPKSKIAVLMSGDCGFYSGAKKLSGLLGDNCTIICGISTPVYLCSRTGRQWEKMKFVSLHGRNGNIAVNVLQNELCFFLLGGSVTPSEVCRVLCRYGLGDVTVLVGENLGYENERITSGRADEFTEIKTSNLCAVIAENKNYIRYIPSCMEDSSFIRGKVPMTKAEIRALAVSYLNVKKDGICWDIGCGTGSVSVEMAMRCPDGMVYGFDKNDEAVNLTLENARNFSCDNITAHCCTFPDIKTENCNVPDCVFIGGTSGKMHDIVDYILKINPSADIVITAVSLETVSECLKLFEADITQIAVTRTKKIGSHTMLSAENPVFIVRRRKCGE
ncbi:MAG: precorrin-6y C5,15-methyltransferase (decarboxylating) subunit CbiE [Ruminococcus flavefaciens]|nr:precorrin-6y C5,15-methyltransferase (decarboxylating) subunit CbiE [Ruminococcus flavefaciens]